MKCCNKVNVSKCILFYCSIFLKFYCTRNHTVAIITNAWGDSCLKKLTRRWTRDGAKLWCSLTTWNTIKLTIQRAAQQMQRNHTKEWVPVWQTTFWIVISRSELSDCDWSDVGTWCAKINNVALFHQYNIKFPGNMASHDPCSRETWCKLCHTMHLHQSSIFWSDHNIRRINTFSMLLHQEWRHKFAALFCDITK